ncbi:hypothetical protein [Actinomadura sp. K4S16]|uniref:hypothetical protein n=1 Tax=Actinomadura sp. K4S16 TaxID=1316147 RepID=UPI001358E323|nr:hypothetical protein [Actinomadura sp. K4S16]
MIVALVEVRSFAAGFWVGAAVGASAVLTACVPLARRRAAARLAQAGPVRDAGGTEGE